MSAPGCVLCGTWLSSRTSEPVIVDPVDVRNLRHPVAVQHARRVLATGTSLCVVCAELVSYLPAVDASAVQSW